MKHTLRILTLGLVASLATSTFANQHSAAEAKEKASKAEAKAQQQLEQEVTNSLLKRIVGALATGGALVGLGASKIPCLEKCGLNVGLGLASVPSFLAFIVAGKERKAATKLAIKVPLYGLVGSAVFNDFTMTKVLGNINLFNINQIAERMKGISASQGAALFITAALAYNLAQPVVNKIGDIAHEKGNDVHDYIAEAVS